MTFIDVPLTNFTTPCIALIRHEDGSVDVLPASFVRAFNGGIQIRPDPKPRVRALARSPSPVALNLVAATVRIDPEMCPHPAGSVQTPYCIEDVLCDLCNLLSFGSRRGVSFKPQPPWASGRRPIRRRVFQTSGPIQTNEEMGRLLERGLPKMYDPTTDRGLRLPTALRWFLGWREGRGIDLKLVRLWIVLEMLQKNERKTCGPPAGGINRLSKGARVEAVDHIYDYLLRLGIPNLNEVPLEAMYQARNVLVHGDPDKAERLMITSFSALAEKRRNELQAGPLPLSLPDGTTFPDPTDYSCCVFEAVDLLSRLLEKTFLALFDCRDTLFYAVAPCHAALAS